MVEEKEVKLYTAEGVGLHIASAKALLELVDSLIARIEALEAR